MNSQWISTFSTVANARSLHGIGLDEAAVPNAPSGDITIAGGDVDCCMVHSVVTIHKAARQYWAIGFSIKPDKDKKRCLQSSNPQISSF